MSWFEGTGFTSLARSALKEAQKTIDKALDIKDPDVPAEDTTSAKLKEGSDSFFAEFGFGPKKIPEESTAEVAKSSAEVSSSMASSLWGSFTGSFSENTGTSTAATTTAKKDVVAIQPINSAKRLDSPPPAEETPPISNLSSTNITDNSSMSTSGGSSKDMNISYQSQEAKRSISLQSQNSKTDGKESFSSIFYSDTHNSFNINHTTNCGNSSSATPHSIASVSEDSDNEHKFLLSPLPVTSSGVANRVGEEEVDWGWGSGITDSVVDNLLQQDSGVSDTGAAADSSSKTNTASSNSCVGEDLSQKPSKTFETLKTPSACELSKSDQAQTPEEPQAPTLILQSVAVTDSSSEDAKMKADSLSSTTTQSEVPSPDECSSVGESEHSNSVSCSKSASSSNDTKTGSSIHGNQTGSKSDDSKSSSISDGSKSSSISDGSKSSSISDGSKSSSISDGSKSSSISDDSKLSSISDGSKPASNSSGSKTTSSSNDCPRSTDSCAVISSTTSSSIETIDEFQSPKSPSPSSLEEDKVPLQLSSSIVDTRKSSLSSSTPSFPRGDTPLTVQPSKSPLKMSPRTTVIDSQVTRSEVVTSKSGGSRWGGSSAASDSDRSDSGSDTTEVASGTITTQPVGVIDSTSISWDGVDSTTNSWDSQKWEGAESTATSWDSQKWDSCSEDMSATESVQSSSSVITLVESGAFSTSEEIVSVSALPDRPSLSNAQLGKLNQSTLSSIQLINCEPLTTLSAVVNISKTPESSSISSRSLNTELHVSSSGINGFLAAGEISSDNNLSPRSSNKNSLTETGFLSHDFSEAKLPENAAGFATGPDLPTSLPLDVSVESGGSSDTITASMDSTTLTGACRDDGEWSTLESETPVPHLLKEAMGEAGRTVDKISDNDQEFSSNCIDKVEKETRKKDQLLKGDVLQKSYVEVEEEYDINARGRNAAPENEVASELSSSGSHHPDSERDHSPSSSDSLTSEMVKVGGSEETSGHTSGDEFETTTSSDIEVISSPSLDGVSVYGGMYNNLGSSSAAGGVLLGPAHNTASRVWHSAQQRLKSFLVEPSPTNGGSSKGSVTGSSGDRGDAVVSPSMTASFTSISESDGGGEVWGMVGGTASPPRVKQKKGDPASQHYFERGHTRNESTQSGTSESSSEHLPPEAEKLSKRVRELTEVLENREQRLLELSQQNVGLQDQNHVLQLRVQELEVGGGGGSDGVEGLSEECIQRLATMEKKFQQELREKELLTKQLEALRAETATRLSSTEVQHQLQERDTIIFELRTEGEKLSKQQLTYSTTIKKLRSKEKELESTNTSFSARIESQQTEIERQHKQLLAKCEVERRQVGAITQLTGQLQQLQDHAKAVTADAAETQGKMDVLRDALDAAYRELGEAKRQESARAAELAEQTLSAEVGAKQQLQEALQQQQRLARKEKQALLLQLEEMQEEKERIQQSADRSERMLRNEVVTLQQRLSESEGRGEQLSVAVAAATRPLLRQIESLQNTHTSHRSAWEELEAQLAHRLQEAEKHAAASAERHRNISDHSAQAIAQQAAMQAKVDNLKEENVTLAAKVQSLSSTVSRLEEERANYRAEAGASRSSLTRDLNTAKAECQALKVQLASEMDALEAEKKRNETLQQQVSELEAKKGGIGSGVGGGNNGGYSRQSSPTPSLSRLSVSGSINSFMAGPYSDDVFEGVGWGSSLRQHSSVYEALRGNAATTVEALTSQLSQREGEVHLLQSEVQRHEAQRESLASELLQLTEQVLQLQQQQDEHKQLKQQHEDTAQKYNALLQMYGEKVEEVDELRLDLADVKEMYKAQINQLMQQ